MGLEYFEPLSEVPEQVIKNIFSYLDEKSLLAMSETSKGINKFIMKHHMSKITIYLDCEPIFTDKGILEPTHVAKIRELIKSKRKYENFVLKNFGASSLCLTPNAFNIVSHFKNNIRKIKFVNARKTPNAFVKILPKLQELQLNGSKSISSIEKNQEVDENLNNLNERTPNLNRNSKKLIKGHSKIRKIPKRLVMNKDLHFGGTSNKSVEYLSLAYSDEGCQNLLKILPNLKKFNAILSNDDLTTNIIYQINNLKRLENLFIHNCLPNNCFKIIKLRKLKIMQFCLSNRGELDGKSWRSFLKTNSHMKCLKIENCGTYITLDLIFDILKLLPELARLELHSICGRNLNDEIVFDICSKARALKVLRIFYYDVRCNWFDYGNIQDFPKVHIEIMKFVKPSQKINYKGQDLIKVQCSSD